MSDWKKIYQSTSIQNIMIIKGMLEEEDVDCRILNKQDSMYVQFNSFTPIELYVKSDDVVKAIRLIESKNIEEP